MSPKTFTNIENSVSVRMHCFFSDMGRHLAMDFVKYVLTSPCGSTDYWLSVA